MRWLLGLFARAIVRRVVVVLVAALFAVLGGRALAADYSMCSPTAPESSGGAYLCPDQGIAAAMAAASASYRSGVGVCGYGPGRATVGGTNVDMGNRVIQVMLLAPTGSACGSIRMEWPPNESCQDRNRNKLADAAPWYSEPSTCVSGCKVQGTPFDYSNGSVKIYGMKDRSYSGDICTPPGPSKGIGPSNDEKDDATKPKGDECNALGSGQTACVKPDGDHCTTASTGKTFCWKPNETGEKKDGTDAQTKGEKGKPVMPPTSPDPTKEYQRKEGHQQTACINNTCTTYNVTNFNETGKGSAKNGTGDNSVDGTGNTSGNGTPGKGSGSGGDKEGEGDSATESGNCSQPPTCVGDTLKCLHLKFTWRIECNTKGNAIANGDGCGDNDVPVCAGEGCKAEAYSQVLQQWKQRCAVQAIGEGMAGRASNISNPDDEGVVDGIWIKEGNGNGPKLRQDLVNVGGGGSLLPQVSIEGHQWEVPQGFYDAIAAVRMVIIAMCTVLAMFIVGRNI